MRVLVQPIITATLLALTPAAVSAQHAEHGDHANPEHHQIMASVYAFMAGLEAKDADAMRAQVLDSSMLTVVRETDAGNSVRSMPMGQVIEALAASPYEIQEPLSGEYAIADGPVAMVWAPYRLMRSGEFSHCGVNIFTLVEQAEAWRIASITYSHVTQGCEEPANQ